MHKQRKTLAGRVLSVTLSLSVILVAATPIFPGSRAEATQQRPIAGGVTITDTPLTSDIYALDEGHRKQGDGYLAEGDLTGALHEYNEALRLNPNNIAALEGRAVVRLLQREYEAAIKDLTLIIRLAPNHALARYLRGSVYFILGRSSAARRDLEQAVALCEAQGDASGARQARQRLATVRYEQGRENAYRGRLQAALEDFSAAIALNPNDIAAYCGRARVLYMVGDLPAALADLNHAVSLAPLYVDAYLARGTLRYIMVDYEGALSDLNQALLINPDLAEAYYVRAMCLAAYGDRDGAERDLRTAYALYVQEKDKNGIALARSALASLGVYV